MVYSLLNEPSQMPDSSKPKVIAGVWEDECTLYYKVIVKGIEVSRRQDNDMINGRKLLNATGMSLTRRNNILKNEKDRIDVKVGPMHLKGVWIPFERARELAAEFNILDLCYPLFADDPFTFDQGNLSKNNSWTSFLVKSKL